MLLCSFCKLLLHIDKMDLVLNRKEREALCKLLEISPNCYGNIPLMKAAFKRSCLKHHPDKGGNPVIMMELNTLWSKFQQNIHKLRSDFSMFDEVSTKFPWEEYGTLKDYMQSGYNARFCRGPGCMLKQLRDSKCACISCKLSRQHCSLKTLKQKNCLTWGECFCYQCFILWFGFPPTWESFDWWQKTLEETDYCLLHLHLF